MSVSDEFTHLELDTDAGASFLITLPNSLLRRILLAGILENPEEMGVGKLPSYLPKTYLDHLFPRGKKPVWQSSQHITEQVVQVPLFS